MLKLPFLSQIISVANIITNFSYEEICVEFERKKTTALVFLLSNCPQVLKIFYNWPFKYYFDYDN